MARYTYAPGYIDAVAIQERDLNSDGDFAHSNEVVYYHSNTLFSVYALSDANETIIERYRYDGYGLATVLDSDGSADGDGLSDVDSPYTFTARRVDVESGLMQYRNRQYDAYLGRFGQRDPAGHDVQSALYVLAGCNPTAHIDPLGLMAYDPDVDRTDLPWMTASQTPSKSMKESNGSKDMYCCTEWTSAESFFEGGLKECMELALTGTPFEDEFETWWNSQNSDVREYFGLVTGMEKLYDVPSFMASAGAQKGIETLVAPGLQQAAKQITQFGGVNITRAGKLGSRIGASQAALALPAGRYVGTLGKVAGKLAGPVGVGTAVWGPFRRMTGRMAILRTMDVCTTEYCSSWYTAKPASDIECYCPEGGDVVSDVTQGRRGQ